MRSLYDAISIARLDSSEFNAANNLGPSIPPQFLSGSTVVTGASFDTKGYQTAVIRAYAAVSTGTPTTSTVVFALTECATIGGTYTAANDNTGTAIASAAMSTKTAAQDYLARIEGLGQNRKRYFKITATPAYTGGTSPTTAVFAEIIASRSFNEPVQTDISNT
jgi:hypothetical protein